MICSPIGLFLGGQTGILGQNSNDVNLKQDLQSAESHSLIGINGNSELNSSDAVTGSGTYNDPYIIENFEIESTSYGINIDDVDAFLIIRNCTLTGDYNSEPGIEIRSSGNITIINNTITNFGRGIDASQVENCSIIDNNCYGNKWDGIDASHAEKTNISNNICNLNVEHGIVVSQSSNGTLSGNTCNSNNGTQSNEGYGIYSNDCQHLNVSDNTCCFNEHNGIYINDLENCTISGNNCSYNGDSNSGIWVDGYDSEYLVLSDNECSFNRHGIDIDGNNDIYHTISDNRCFNNSDQGISLYKSKKCTISGNDCFFNGYDGIGAYELCEDNEFLDNNCSFNGDDGLHLGISSYESDDNTIKGNYIANNSDYGLKLHKSDGSSIYMNVFKGNSEQIWFCSDSTYQNEWDNGSVGNYYGDYKTLYPGATHDGYIWDTPYEIDDDPTRQDDYPFVYEDMMPRDIAAPNISINSPIPKQVFGVNAPSFNVEITDENLNATWYSLNEAVNLTFISNNTINQTEWNSLEDGTILITFYANDTEGNTASQNVTVKKDTSAPNITIISPEEGEEFGSNAPSFEVEITDLELNTTWYSLGTGQNVTFTDNETIESSLWASLPEGPLTITFYANDTIGTLALESIQVIKNITIPTIDILTPSLGEEFGFNPPSFTIEISNADFNTTWYSLNDGENVTFTSNETIDQSLWAALPDGAITITFYANNTEGTLISESITVLKNTTAPTINILSPRPSQEFGSNAPSFMIEVNQFELDTMWYSFNGGQNFTFTSNSTFNQAFWTAQPEGSVTITFYANNTAGRVNSESLDVIKDSTVPNITILSPNESTLFCQNAPNFTIKIIDRKINSTWYTLSGGKPIFFTGNGTINQTAWNALSDGTITITFYANDSVGNRASESVEIPRDTTAPSWDPAPTDQTVEYGRGFEYDIDATDSVSIHSFWVNSSAFAINGNGTIVNATIFSSSKYSLKIHVNDTCGNNNSIIIEIILIPRIKINQPVANEIYRGNAPSFDLEIYATNLNSAWYSIEGIQNFTITFPYNGTVNQTLWEALPNGLVTITFYARDTAGHLASKSLDIIKATYIRGTDQIPSYPLLLMLFITSLSITGLVLHYRKKQM